MTEFNDSIKGIDEKIVSLEKDLAEVKQNKISAKKNAASSAEHQNRKNVLLGLQHLEKSNQRAFANAKTEEERNILADRARELAKEITKVKAEFSKHSVDLDSYKIAEASIRDEINQLKDERKSLEKKNELHKALEKAWSFDSRIDVLEGFFNLAYNENGGFVDDDEDFYQSSFVQGSVSAVLAESFSAAQVSILMDFSFRSTKSFVQGYVDYDYDWNVIPGVFFNILRVQISAVNAFKELDAVKA